MRKLTVVFFSLLLFNPVFSQKNTIRQGDKNFDNYHYRKSIDRFERIENKSPDISRKLADAYRLLGNTEKAEEYYVEVVGDTIATATDIYNYAATLRSNGKYDQSRVWMDKFHEVEKEDTRGLKHNLGADAIAKLSADQGKYRIRNLEINSEQEDFGTSYYKNQVVFASSREGVVPIKRTWNWNELPFLDMYVATSNDSGGLDNLKELSERLNGKYHEGPASFTEDGTFMVFTRNNYAGKSEKGVVKLQLFSSRMEAGKWSKEKELPFNSAEYSVGHPSLNIAGTEMYFASDMPGGFGGTDIYKALRTPEGSWGDAVNLGNDINTEGNEMFPFFHESGILFFASDGHGGLGGLDNFLARISDGNVGKVENMGYPVNDKKDDFALILDDAMKTGYFSSNRPGGKGNDDLYYFDLLKPFKFGKTIKGVARDKNGELLAGTLVELFNDRGEVIQTATADQNGAYAFDVESGKTFKLKGAKADYFGDEKEVSSETDEEEIELDLELEKDPGLSIYCLIVNHQNQVPIEGVKITLLNNMTGVTEEIITDGTGAFSRALADKKLNDRISYNITLEKEGYLTKTGTYNAVLDREGQYDIHENLNVAMDKIDLGADLSKIIDINPIYFDLGKHAIRKDAMVELNKIVKVMNENPKMKIELGSHTDCRASAKFNMSLSDKRAKSSAKYVHDHITEPERIYGRGYGESELINKCECEGSKKVPCTEEEHQENRRTEFKIIDIGQ